MMKRKEQVVLVFLLMIQVGAKAQELNQRIFEETLGRSKLEIKGSDGYHNTFGLSLRSMNEKQQMFTQQKVNLGLSLTESKTKLGSEKSSQHFSELPQGSWGINITPHYRKIASLSGGTTIKGLTIGVDREIFLGKRVSLLPGIGYSRQHINYHADDSYDYDLQSFNVTLASRIRFTNPDKRLVFFFQSSLGYNWDFRKYEGIDSWQDYGGRWTFDLGIGAEYKLTNQVSLTGVLSPGWGSVDGFKVNAQIGVRFRF